MGISESLEITFLKPDIPEEHFILILTSLYLAVGAPLYLFQPLRGQVLQLLLYSTSATHRQEKVKA